MLHCENRIKQYHTSSAADLLKEVMGYYGITQSDLAKRIGVSQKNISDISIYQNIFRILFLLKSVFL